MKINFSAFGYYCGIAINWKKLQNDVYGYTNRCIDGKYIITLDYDGLELEWIIQELKALQEMFELGIFYIFQSNKGYHAVCFDKVNLNEYLKIVHNTSVDSDYINVPLRYGQKLWTLRITPKNEKEIKYVDCLFSKYHKNEKSLAHKNLLRHYFNNIFSDVGFDNNTKLIMSKYRI